MIVAWRGGRKWINTMCHLHEFIVYRRGTQFVRPFSRRLSGDEEFIRMWLWLAYSFEKFYFLFWSCVLQNKQSYWICMSQVRRMNRFSYSRGCAKSKNSCRTHHVIVGAELISFCLSEVNCDSGWLWISPHDSDVRVVHSTVIVTNCKYCDVLRYNNKNWMRQPAARN